MADELLPRNEEFGLAKSDQANNFLVVAPNVIVFERLKVDFANAAVFRELKLVPPGWSLDLSVLLRGDFLEPAGRGNLIVTNIQQLYDNRTTWKPKNAVERILGKAVVKGGADGRPMIDRVRSLKKLAVLNDEAHHVHEPDLQWNQIITKLHDNADGGLRSWLDFSATPRFGSGALHVRHAFGDEQRPSGRAGQCRRNLCKAPKRLHTNLASSSTQNARGYGRLRLELWQGLEAF